MFLHFEVIKGCHQFISILVSQKTSPTVLPGRFSPFQLWPPPVPSSLDTNGPSAWGHRQTAGQLQIFQVDVDKKSVVFFWKIGVGPLKKKSARNKTLDDFFWYKVTNPSHFLKLSRFSKTRKFANNKKHEKKHLPVQQKAMISSKRSCCGRMCCWIWSADYTGGLNKNACGHHLIEEGNLQIKPCSKGEALRAFNICQDAIQKGQDHSCDGTLHVECANPIKCL